MGRFVLMCFFRYYGHEIYVNRVSQSHDEEDSCVHRDMYTVKS